MRLLVSVRDIAEALVVADAGVHLIDCKEPRDGALGALPLDTVAGIVEALRRHGHAGEISATVGDWSADAPLDALLQRVRRVAACGVDVVKVGIASPGWLSPLAACGSPVVPVLLADDGIDLALLRAAGRTFATLMLDTADKRAGSLCARRPVAELRRAVLLAHEAGRRIGVAGSLRVSDLPLLHDVAADFAGFRGALCDGDRGDRLSEARVRGLLRAWTPPTAAQLVRLPTTTP